MVSRTPTPPRPRVLSIIIPAYQEESTIREVLERVCAAPTERLGFTKEIIVCDDGSTDGTPDVLRTLADAGCIRLLTHPRNRGKGAAIRTALTVCRGDFVLIQDADLEYDVGDYPRLLQPVLEGARVVYGSRFASRAYPVGMRWQNYVANRVLTWTANALYGVGITDEATCFKLFETRLLRSLDLTCTRFEFCPEVTSKLGKARVPIVEVPVRYRARTVSSGKKVRWTDGIHAFWVLLRHRFAPPPQPLPEPAAYPGD